MNNININSKGEKYVIKDSKNVIINGKKGGRCSFAVEVPMDAVGELANKVEHKIGHFHVGQEIFENQPTVAMYKECGVHNAKIMFFLLCGSLK